MGDTSLVLVGDSGRIYTVQKKEIVIGITSILDKYTHFILIDYDRIPKEKLIKEIKHLQEYFILPDFYIFRTSKGHYSAMCFYACTSDFYFRVLLRANCDPNFRYYTIRSGVGTIRITRKHDKKSSHITPIMVIRSKYGRGNIKLRNKVLQVIGYETPDKGIYIEV